MDKFIYIGEKLVGKLIQDLPDKFLVQSFWSGKLVYVLHTLKGVNVRDTGESKEVYRA